MSGTRIVWAAAIAIAIAAGAPGCKKLKGNTEEATAELTPGATGGGTPANDELKVGDKILVEWKGDVYPAKITKVNGPNLFLIHYDGYGHEWDEVITKARIRGRVGGGAISAPAAATGDYKVGDKVTVSWKGGLYPATITAVRGNVYAIHYDGWGSEWDESVGPSRIKGRR